MTEISIDNRIILALVEVAGKDNDLDNIFVFAEEGKSPIFFASDGKVAVKIQERQGEFNFNGDYALQIPILLKKVLKYDKKENNPDINRTIFRETATGNIEASFYNKDPFKILFTKPLNLRFDKMPDDIWKEETIEQGAIVFDLHYANKLVKAFSRLGFPPMSNFLLGDERMSGVKQNEEFIVEYVIARGSYEE